LENTEDILLVLGFVPLVQHMDKHALTVPMGDNQVSHLSLQPANLSHRLIPLQSHLSQLC
jgi:hypothetical protein